MGEDQTRVAGAKPILYKSCENFQFREPVYIRIKIDPLDGAARATMSEVYVTQKDVFCGEEEADPKKALEAFIQGKKERTSKSTSALTWSGDRYWYVTRGSLSIGNSDPELAVSKLEKAEETRARAQEEKEKREQMAPPSAREYAFVKEYFAAGGYEDSVRRCDSAGRCTYK